MCTLMPRRPFHLHVDRTSLAPYIHAGTEARQAGRMVDIQCTSCTESRAMRRSARPSRLTLWTWRDGVQGLVDVLYVVT